jgi:hypothetical protein
MTTKFSYDQQHLANDILDNPLPTQNKIKEFTDNANDANADHQHWECNDNETIIIDNGDGCSDLPTKFGVVHTPNNSGKTGKNGAGSRYAIGDRDNDTVTLISGEKKMSIDYKKFQDNPHSDYISCGVPSTEEKLQNSKIQRKAGMNQIGLVIIIKHAPNSCHKLNNYAKSINNVTAPPPKAKENLAFTLDYDREFKITFSFDNEEKIHIFKSFIQLQNDKLVNVEVSYFYYMPSCGHTYLQFGDKYFDCWEEKKEKIKEKSKKIKFDKKQSSIEDFIRDNHPCEVPHRGKIINGTQGPAHDNFMKTKMENGYNNTKDQESFNTSKQLHRDIYNDSLKQLGYEGGYDDIGEADSYDVLSSFPLCRNGSAIRTEKKKGSGRTGRLDTAKLVVTQSKIMVREDLDVKLGVHANKHMPTKYTPTSILIAVNKSRQCHQDKFIFNYDPYTNARKRTLHAEDDELLSSNNTIQDEPTLDETPITNGNNNNKSSGGGGKTNALELLTAVYDPDIVDAGGKKNALELLNSNYSGDKKGISEDIKECDSVIDTEGKKGRISHLVKPHIRGDINYHWLHSYIMGSTPQQIYDLISGDEKLAKEFVNKLIQDPKIHESYNKSI